ncbi:Rz1-like lysis system protein LysC [Metapseudomonas resinovorans]|uniref:Rz1-like lysis system protein LysC n=1 Tax=Metapseudomonas resinovorans TaxID=53412 RepID=UPI003D21D2E5
MTRASTTICALLCLLPLAACTSAPKPPTPLPTAARQFCPLVPCRLPGRPALASNEDWRRAVDELESELQRCAGQVLDCIGRQEAQMP